MSESPAPIEVRQVKKDLLDPRTISKNSDQEGRDKLASDIRDSRVLNDDIKTTETKLDERNKSILVKLKDKLRIPDKQKVELEEQLLEQRTKQDELPDPKKMIEAYYEKASESPLTNQEKRDFLKPEILAELSSEEYVALWKRLNPHFLTHVTRQGLRDHTGGDPMVSHSSNYNLFVDGFTDVMKNKKRIYPPLARIGLRDRDEATIKIFLSKYVLQAESENEALERFDTVLHYSMGAAPTYPDHTSTHLAAQIASDTYYGGETNNEVFFVYPSDVLASQYPYAFNGWQKDFTHPQSETKWNDVFIWTDPDKPGIPVDSGVVFLPKDTMVDPSTGSKYASEMIRMKDGQDQRVPIIDQLLIDRFDKWAKELTEDSPVIKAIDDAHKRNNSDNFHRILEDEMRKIGVPEDSMWALLYLNGLSQDIFIFREKHPTENKYLDNFKRSNAKYKRAENTIGAKEYWEKYFDEHPDQKPKHIAYYNGDPTNAIYKFEQENGIGSADTSKVDGQLLGFNDNHVVDMATDSRSNVGHQELIDLGNKIIKEHYATSLETA